MDSWLELWYDLANVPRARGAVTEEETPTGNTICGNR